MSWLFLFCNVFIVDLQLFEICLVAKDVLWQILNRIFRQRERERERERDVGESLLKYSDSRPPKAELHEI